MTSRKSFMFMASPDDFSNPPLRKKLEVIATVARLELPRLLALVCRRGLEGAAR
jgi:hypothetical protein